ncbi:MAG: UvrD-helicase domain-containing protein [Ilumatobacter sp.]|nr:UvrD-helicase domain-containing protein [Ilumatobacter sp.]
MTTLDVLDQGERRLISADGLDRTLFVEAGAGTGKTKQLVERIVSTVLRADVALSDIVAITFTEAAASELTTRIRAAFEARLADPDTPTADRERCARAIADADLAAISTVHGFASRLLSEFSVAAGLPPRVTVLDEVSSQLAHERRWERFVDRLHDAPEHEELLYRAALIGIPLSPTYHGEASFKDVAATFGQHWDRLDVLIDAESAPLPALDFAPFDAAVAALAEVRATCLDPSDRLAEHIDRLLPSMRTVVDLTDPHHKLRALTRRANWPKSRFGTQAAWGCPAVEIRELIEHVNDAAQASLAEAGAAVVDRLMRLTAAEVRNAAHERRANGGLEFHDLLVLALRMLRRSPEVRRALHDRYRHLLLDEFQDTDPIQIELASLIAAEPTAEPPGRWSDLPIEQGRLFFVGDPKQSIYRFRRADIGLFLAARDAFGGSGPVGLRTNFRTVAPIIDWVNAVFAEAMPEELPGAQPKYEPLVAARAADSGHDHRPLVFGSAHPDPKVRAGELREAEAADVGAIVRDVIDRPDRWPVFDRRLDRWRPARPSDVAILIPTRTSLPFLRDALDRDDVPYRLATGTLVYDTQEVRDLLAVLRAVDDPNDTLSLIAALRSPLYGCSDVDLYTYHAARRRWDLRGTVPEGLDDSHPVVRALAHLRELWLDRWWVGPADLLGRVMHDRRAFLLGYGDPRPAEVWRRLRFVLDQARAFEEADGGETRAFLEWAALQSSDGARVHEPLLPETDDDAPQILTVHGSKGLEFPIVVLSGLTTRPANRRPGVSVLWGDDGVPEVKLRADVATAQHEPRADLEEEMDAHEKLRLLYVAATRARDHLAVSGHHKAGGDPNGTFAGRVAAFHDANPVLARPFELGGAEADGVGPDVPGETSDAVAATDGSPGVAGASLGRNGSPGDALADRDGWIAERSALLAPFRRPSTMSATAIARTVDPTIDDVDDDSRNGADARPLVRRRGRAGSAVGRAVHATLEYVAFDQPHDVRELAQRQCELEAIPALVDTVEQLVQAALASDAVALARRHRFHRELYVAATVGTTTIEGYVDLLVVTPDGLVVVDYKTDGATSPAEIDAKVAAYELQGAAYAVALEASTGLPVVDCRFVFCTTNGPVERSITDLDGAKRRVRDTVTGAPDGVADDPAPGDQGTLF